MIGTPAFMPPEQARGEVARLGPASDVYAVGAMLYHLLCGHMPYADGGVLRSGSATLQLLLAGSPTPVHERAPSAPAELVAICEKAMARDPAARFPSMVEFAEDLRAYLEHRVVAAYRTGAGPELVKWVQRNRATAVAVAALACVTVVGVSIAAWQQHRLAAQAVRAHDLLGIREPRRPSCDVYPMVHMGLHYSVLAVVQLPRLEQHFVPDADLAHVVQQ